MYVGENRKVVRLSGSQRRSYGGRLRLAWSPFATVWPDSVGCWQVVMGLDADDGRFADLRRLVAGADRAPEDDPPEGASAAELARLSDRLGRSLPLLLRSWLSICRGAAIGPGGVFGQRPDRPGLDMVSIRDLSPEWQSLGWLPVAGDGCGNYYVLTEGGTVGFVEPMSDPGRLERQVSSDLLSFMADLLAAHQVPPG